MMYRVKCPACQKMTNVYFESHLLNFYEVFQCEECNEYFAVNFDITIKHDVFNLAKEKPKTARKKTVSKTNKKPGKKPGPKPKKKAK